MVANPCPQPVITLFVTVWNAAVSFALDDLEDWLGAQLPKISGKSELAKATRCALSRLPKLRPYLDHGFLEGIVRTICLEPTYAAG